MTLDNVEEIYELSPIQEGILFHSLLAPESQLYHEQFSVEVNGTLNVDALARSWQYVVDLNPVLRTSFFWEGLERPLQVVHREVELPFDLLDWQGEFAAAQACKLAEYLADDRRRGFDIARAPLVRLALIQLAPQSYRFVMSFHHIVLDGWSLALIIQQAAEAFEDYRTAREPAVHPGRPFVDYVEWLSENDREASLQFWRRMLAGFKGPGRLCIEQPETGQAIASQDAYEQQQLAAPEALTNAARTFARRHRLTINTLVQAAWAILISRYGDQRDVVFGTVVSGRPPSMRGVERMVGLFINTLPLRVHVNSEAPLLPWLSALQAGQFEARQFEYSSLVDIQGVSGVPRGTPMFNTIVGFENYPSAAATAPPSVDVHIDLFERTNYPLTLVVDPNRGLHFRLLHRRSQFDPESVQRMLGHLLNVVEAIVAEPERRISEIELMGAAERQQVVEGWNRTTTGYPREATVAELVAAQAAAQRDAVAVVEEGATLTYGALEEQANQLAHVLRELGVATGTRVAVCLERSSACIRALLAVLKAGGVYVPLDAAYPPARLGFMVADTGTAVVVTTAALRGRVPAMGVPVVCVEDAAVAAAPARPVESGASGGSLAYIMYTSGSTGEPKGVAVPHRAIVRLARETNYVQLTAADRVAHASSVAFDAATFEIWGALMTGGQVVIVPKAVALDARELRACLQRHAVTVLFVTTDLFHQLVSVDGRLFESVQTLLFGGTAVDPARVRAVLQQGPPRRLVHVYGPTESTTFATWQLVEEVPDEAATVPIGQPISNTQVYVLDEQRQAVPVGMPGELYIGGDGLAEGYFQHPALTAERFVAHPFSAVPGARLYRTGDRVRQRADGAVEFLGRFDDQVKLRGFRVEPSEVEAALRRHPAVREAVVIAREDTPGDKRLVAYVVTLEPDPDITRTLRSFLASHIPDFMIPSAFVRLETLPLAANGKVARDLLPTPVAVVNPAQHFAEPRTNVERQLAAIWAEVLSVPKVGIDDNFFALGGHSLLATRVVSRIRDALQTPIPLRTLFDRPTVASLAEAIHTFHAGDRSVDGAVSSLCEVATGADLVRLPDADIDTMLAALLDSGDAANLRSGSPD